MGQVSVAVVCVAIVLALPGDVLVTQAGTATAVVNVVVLAAAQVVAAPVAFLGAIYQLYWVAAVRPAALYVVVATFAVGDEGAVAPVHRYTSYEVAPDDEGQVSVAVVDVPIVLVLAGDVLITHDGNAAPMLKVVVLLVEQPVAEPILFLGTTYHL